MSQKHNILSIKRVKRGKQLVFKSKGDLAMYQEFVNSLEDGQVVEEYLESNVDNGTNLQLAKIHACIRELAKEIGYTFEEMKSEIKRRTGFKTSYKDLEYEKSFADCSIEVLGLVIETIVEIGDTVGINFRGHFPQRV